MRTRTARRLRPIAKERARQMKMQVGDEVFYGDIVYSMVRVYSTGRMKPYPHVLYQSLRSGAIFGGSSCWAYPKQWQHDLFTIAFVGRPKRRRRLENRIRNKERKAALRALRNGKDTVSE